MPSSAQVEPSNEQVVEKKANETRKNPLLEKTVSAPVFQSYRGSKIDEDSRSTDCSSSENEESSDSGQDPAERFVKESKRHFKKYIPDTAWGLILITKLFKL